MVLRDYLRWLREFLCHMETASSFPANTLRQLRNQAGSRGIAELVFAVILGMAVSPRESHARSLVDSFLQLLRQAPAMDALDCMRLGVLLAVAIARMSGCDDDDDDEMNDEMNGVVNDDNNNDDMNNNNDDEDDMNGDEEDNVNHKPVVTGEMTPEDHEDTKSHEKTKDRHETNNITTLSNNDKKTTISNNNSPNPSMKPTRSIRFIEDTFFTLEEIMAETVNLHDTNSLHLRSTLLAAMGNQVESPAVIHTSVQWRKFRDFFWHSASWRFKSIIRFHPMKRPQ